MTGASESTALKSSITLRASTPGGYGGGGGAAAAAAAAAGSEGSAVAVVAVDVVDVSCSSSRFLLLK